MFTIDSGKIPILIWLESLEDIESGALTQAKNLANLPFAYHHIAIMPDTHQGYGMPIGGVLASLDHVIPNAVGVDIGCGMCAVRTSLREKDLTQEKLKNLMSSIRANIPLGFNHHKSKQPEKYMPKVKDKEDQLKIVKSEYNSALKQIGTLGGGNHFIEIQKDDESRIWLMIHSGSRNLGFKVAKHYNNVAKDIASREGNSQLMENELCSLRIDSEEAQNYLFEMNFCVDFALANRELMMERVKEGVMRIFESVGFDEMINIAHNFASLETHYDKEVWIHRKGATPAFKDQLGIIPGSQGSKSYIVKGKGNPKSFKSCSHGAGRTMSRTKARKELDLKKEIKKMDKKGILHGIRGKKDLDEAPGAYKSIFKVMENQKDLVEVVRELSPICVIKA